MFANQRCPNYTERKANGENVRRRDEPQETKSAYAQNETGHKGDAVSRRAIDGRGQGPAERRASGAESGRRGVRRSEEHAGDARAIPRPRARYFAARALLFAIETDAPKNASSTKAATTARIAYAAAGPQSENT